MNAIFIKGNLLVDKLTIVNGGGVKSYVSDLEQVKSCSIIIDSSLDVKGEFIVDNCILLVTGEVMERRMQ